MNDLSEIKLIVINMAALALTFVEVLVGLRIILLLVSIGFTAHKWHLLIKENKKKKDGK